MSKSIAELARHLNLSKATISKALNNYTDVSPKTRQRVIAAAEELGYHPNVMSRNLRRGSTRLIGVVNFQSFMVEYFARILLGTASTAEETDYNLVLYTTAEKDTNRLIRACLSKEVDGMLVMGVSKMGKAIEAMADSGIPLVVIGRPTAYPRISSVAPDNETGAYLAVEHLLSLGHSRIAYIGQEGDLQITEARCAGYRQAMNAAQIPIDPAWIITAPYGPDGGQAATLQLLSLPQRPSAVFCYSDWLAAEVMATLHQNNIRIPQEMAIVGFDGSNLSEKLQPPLTTIHISMEEMGQIAFETLMQKINNPQFSPPTVISMPPTLIIRNSSMPEQPEG